MRTKVLDGIVVGEADVDPTVPSHVPGVHEGNKPRRLLSALGVRVREVRTIYAPTRSTGIAARHHAPIDPTMPFLTPP